MGNETSKGLSVNVKTFILVLVFVNVGFASKMIHKYYAMKETGYIREQTFKEQLEQRVMKSFGSMEEMNQMIADITRQKEEAEKLADSFKEQGEQLRFTNVKIEDSKSKLEEEKARLQKQIWELEDALSQGKKETLIQELTSKIEVLEKENAELKERLK
jgi:chromosome segregation ATPase